MPRCANSNTPLGFVVALLVFASACSTEVVSEEEAPEETVAAPVGLYTSSCDPQATIYFQPTGTAQLQISNCHEYVTEIWDYEVEGDTVIMAPDGKLEEPSARVHFRIVRRGELELVGILGVCNTCETWLAQ